MPVVLTELIQMLPLLLYKPLNQFNADMVVTWSMVTKKQCRHRGAMVYGLPRKSYLEFQYLINVWWSYFWLFCSSLANFFLVIIVSLALVCRAFDLIMLFTVNTGIFEDWKTEEEGEVFPPEEVRNQGVGCWNHSVRS